jgi:hypothetical protein
MNFSLFTAAAMISLTSVLKIIAQILNAGVAITAIALAMYALSFDFRDHIARTFMIILALVAIVFTSDTIANISNSSAIIQAWLQLRWAAMALMPAAYFYFSDALLTITGRPSRGRRTLLARVFMLISLVWAVLIPLRITVGALAADANPVAYLFTEPGFGCVWSLLPGGARPILLQPGPGGAAQQHYHYPPAAFLPFYRGQRPRNHLRALSFSRQRTFFLAIRTFSGCSPILARSSPALPWW